MKMWQLLIVFALFIGGCTYQWGLGGFLLGFGACAVFFALFVRRRR